MTKQTLSIMQVIALSSSSYFPVLFWIYPQLAIHYAMLDAQWAVLAVAVLGIGINWLHGKLNDRFPNMTGADSVNLLFGKFVGKLIVCLYVPVYILFLSLSLYFMSNLMKYFFPNTPKYVFIGLLMAASWRGAMGGVESLGRAASIVHSLTFGGLILTFGVVYLQAEHRMIPITLTHPTAVAVSTFHLLPLYLGVDLVLMLSPYYKHLPKKSQWYPVWGAIAGGIVLILVFLSIVANLGWVPTERLSFPVQVVIQLIRIHGFVIERLGIVIIILSVAFVTVFAANHIWALSATLACLFNRSDHDFKPFTYLVVPAVFIVSIIIQNGAQARILVDIVLAPASAVLTILVPLLKLFISSVFGIRTDDRGERPPARSRQHRRANA
ncbi:GerAB/ArcD/ProY family transporter [Alicyclobacillus acidiphilus]|uniref:GerAB/ArcD/ProY family transporter n=1 Tax=Alicyclobacillus acidiphilus TaxID=182455 RepID=UPI00083555A6|nr:GerAB/ArcD/ProY family transporter [Alicyclobacillus acidiphilus]